LFYHEVACLTFAGMDCAKRKAAEKSNVSSATTGIGRESHAKMREIHATVS
jgi:hypothetical protein